MSATQAGQSTLLANDDPPPFSTIDVPTSRPALLVCDHASARIPRALGTLGLPEDALTLHIALDVGAAAVVRYLSRRLALPAVLAGYSRLLVDCNRSLSDPTAFPEYSDGRCIPGNRDLGHTDRQARADAVYWPYHHAIRDRLASLERLGEAPALIAIHSFSPRLGGTDRPWHIGILWDKDPRIPKPLMRTLRALPGVTVGDNEPYSGKHPSDFTVDHHAEAEGLPHVSIELRQDLISSNTGVEQWGDLLADALLLVLDEPDLYTHWSGP
jgi:predicted N-formylglutamate amidohydrolase